jgi:hypothetical protein
MKSQAHAHTGRDERPVRVWHHEGSQGLHLAICHEGCCHGGILRVGSAAEPARDAAGFGPPNAFRTDQSQEGTEEAHRHHPARQDPIIRDEAPSHRRQRQRQPTRAPSALNGGNPAA